jgi:hypothetical protein
LALYNKNLFYWPLKIGDHIAYVRHPFFEYQADPVFKVTSLNSNGTFNIICVKSTFLNTGTILQNQTLDGYRKVKLTTVTEELNYNYRI